MCIVVGSASMQRSIEKNCYFVKRVTDAPNCWCRGPQDKVR